MCKMLPGFPALQNNANLSGPIWSEVSHFQKTCAHFRMGRIEDFSQHAQHGIPPLMRMDRLLRLDLRACGDVLVHVTRQDAPQSTFSG